MRKHMFISLYIHRAVSFTVLCNLYYSVKHDNPCPLFYPSRVKIKMDYSKDLNPFETLPSQQYNKLFFHLKVRARLALI